MSITVSALWYCPIKGTGGVWHTINGESVSVDERGILHDRQWLVVDGRGMFVSQRQGTTAGVAIKRMCLISSRIDREELVVTAPEMPELRIPLRQTGKVVSVQVWSNASLTGVEQGREANEWFSRFLSKERSGSYRLVRMASNCRRMSKHGTAALGFHDAFPFMIISDASLGNLNGMLMANGGDAVTADRFRPNVWLRGCEPHQEDHFSSVRIGEITFEGQTLCERCVTTCINQKTGEQGKEPLATLASYRRGALVGVDEKPNGVFFGRNFNHLNPGRLAVGDEVQVLRLD